MEGHALWFSSPQPAMVGTDLKIGDVVLIKYETKSKPGAYRLRIIVDLEVDADNLVRTVLAAYSLLKELWPEERLEYKGVTKKVVRVAVQ